MRSGQNNNGKSAGNQLSSDLLKKIMESQARIIAKYRHQILCLKRKLARGDAMRNRIRADCSNNLKRHALSLDGMISAVEKEKQERIKNQEALQDCHARYNALAASSFDHIFSLNENGTYIYSNDRVSQFDLNKGGDLVGKRLQDVYPAQLYGFYSEHLQEVIHRRVVVSFYHEKTMKEGIQHHLDTLYPIVREDQVIAIGGICRDISKQKQIEKQLFQSQKMESLGTLVAGIAHEINNPINLMLLNLPLLDKMWADIIPFLDQQYQLSADFKIGGLPYGFIKENLPRLISDMELAAHRVARIVSGLKDFSRKSNPAEKKDVQINQAVENAARLAASTLKTNKALLSLELASGLPFLHANLQHLEQIILNLIINALQSIDHDRGQVVVKTSKNNANQTVVVEVSDNGRGVNPVVADKLFDPFVTDRQANGGTGLGLSVTYNLVKAHQGDISFKTKPGAGATFLVALPISPKKRLHRIIVVDDDKNFCNMLIDALSHRTNSSVEGFSNGVEALIRLGGNPPDLLVLDMFMPQVDGLGVCRAIKNELGSTVTKVIIVTGYPEHPNVLEAAKMGFDQIFAKPLDIELFIKTVKECLHGDTSD